MHEQPARKAYTITEFADAHAISRTTAYAEARRGRLALTKIGRRTIVTDEAATAWRRRCEAETAARATPEPTGTHHA